METSGGKQTRTYIAKVKNGIKKETAVLFSNEEGNETSGK